MVELPRPTEYLCMSGITDLLAPTRNTYLEDVAEHKELHSNLINTEVLSSLFSIHQRKGSPRLLCNPARLTIFFSSSNKEHGFHAQAPYESPSHFLANLH